MSNDNSTGPPYISRYSADWVENHPYGVGENTAGRVPSAASYPSGRCTEKPPLADYSACAGAIRSCTELVLAREGEAQREYYQLEELIELCHDLLRGLVLRQEALSLRGRSDEAVPVPEGPHIGGTFHPVGNWIDEEPAADNSYVQWIAKQGNLQPGHVTTDRGSHDGSPETGEQGPTDTGSDGSDT